MLTKYGPRLLAWLDEVLLPEAANVLDDFAEYITRWRELLEDRS
jgi:hypothetical protein